LHVVPDEPAQWTTADPAIASVDADGTFHALRPGAAWVTAHTGKGATAVSLVACVAQPAPALVYRFSGDESVPLDSAPRGAFVLASDADWQAFWRRTMRLWPTGRIPTLDFARYRVVALVDDRATYTETAPMLTHVSDDGGVVHVVFPGSVASGVAYHRNICLFLTGLLRPDATVHVQTLCSPD
jgi:hypothetical protein